MFTSEAFQKSFEFKSLQIRYCDILEWYVVQNIHFMEMHWIVDCIMISSLCNLQLYTLKSTSYFSQEKRVWILRDSINAKICNHLYFSIVLCPFVGPLVEQSMLIVYYFIIDFISFESITNQTFAIHTCINRAGQYDPCYCSAFDSTYFNNLHFKNRIENY